MKNNLSSGGGNDFPRKYAPLIFYGQSCAPHYFSVIAQLMSNQGYWNSYEFPVNNNKKRLRTKLVKSILSFYLLLGSSTLYLLLG